MAKDSNGTTTRGTSNKNVSGSSYDRRRRKEWMLSTFAADSKLVKVTWDDGSVSVEDFVVGVDHLRTFPQVKEAEEIPTCRCYRCGRLLWFETLTTDRIIPGCKGGTYRRNNIRPACSACNSETGGPLANGKEHRAAKVAARKRASKKGRVEMSQDEVAELEAVLEPEGWEPPSTLEAAKILGRAANPDATGASVLSNT